MVNFNPLISVGEFGAPQQISTGFASWLPYCTNATQWRSTKLCTMFDLLLDWYTIYTFWGLLPRGILPGAKFTLRPSLPFSYIGRVTARHSSSGRQPDCGVVSSRDRAAIPFDIGQSNYLVVFILLYISFDWWMCAFVVFVLVCPYQAKRLAWGTYPKWPILCGVGVGHKTSTQSINQDQELYYS